MGTGGKDRGGGGGGGGRDVDVYMYLYNSHNAIGSNASIIILVVLRGGATAADSSARHRLPSVLCR
eukprot:COSAG05_NODE_1_length_66591_cov_307.301581_46_plen_66_part_00